MAVGDGVKTIVLRMPPFVWGNGAPSYLEAFMPGRQFPETPDPKSQPFLTCLKYWTLNSNPLTVYPE